MPKINVSRFGVSGNDIEVQISGECIDCRFRRGAYCLAFEKQLAFEIEKVFFGLIDKHTILRSPECIAAEMEENNGKSE